MNKSIVGPDGTPILPPQGVEYSGCFSMGPFLVLHFASPAFYCDRFYDGSGKEVFRETGESLSSPVSWWRRLLR